MASVPSPDTKQTRICGFNRTSTSATAFVRSTVTRLYASSVMPAEETPQAIEAGVVPPEPIGHLLEGEEVGMHELVELVVHDTDTSPSDDQDPLDGCVLEAFDQRPAAHHPG